MRSKLQKLVIPIIIFHLFGDVVYRAGGLSDKVTTPTHDSPYVTPAATAEKKAIRNIQEAKIFNTKTDCIGGNCKGKD